MVYKKNHFSEYVYGTPDPPSFMEKTILNFHSDYWNPSLICIQLHIQYTHAHLYCLLDRLFCLSSKQSTYPNNLIYQTYFHQKKIIFKTPYLAQKMIFLLLKWCSCSKISTFWLNINGRGQPHIQIFQFWFIQMGKIQAHASESRSKYAQIHMFPP